MAGPLALTTPRAKIVFGLAAIGALATIVLANRWSLEYLSNVVDDSLISMNYARRLASGDGLVFNPGEHVEGYTNFGWTVAMAPMWWLSHLFRGNFVHFCVQESILVAALDVVLAALLARRLFGDRALAIGFVIGLLVLDNSYTVWAMMALESHFIALWVLLALLAWTSRLRHRTVLTGLCLALVPMARPDGALFVFAFAVSQSLDVVVSWFRGNRELFRARAIALGATLGVSALAFGVYYAWRYHYYGYPLPNTFYLKVGSSHFAGLERGIGYVKSFFEERGELPLLALAALPWLGNASLRALFLWVAIHIPYVAYVGGDFYSGHRLLVQLLPAIALLSAAPVAGLSRLLDRPRVDAFVRRIGIRSACFALMGIVVLGCMGQQWVLGMEKGPLKLEIRTWRYPVDTQRRYMLWLARHSNPHDYISTGDIGCAGLYADLRVIDYYGVIDAHVAHQDVPTLGRGKPGHEKTADVGYVLGRHPKFIKWGYLPGDFWTRGYYFDNEIPLDIGMPGIWIRDDLAKNGRLIPASVIHFGPKPLPGWSASGDAFETWPSDRSSTGENSLAGAEGWFVSSFRRGLGDRATGVLSSAPLELSGDRMVLRVGGGHDPERLHVDLLVDGQVRFSETGVQSETLGRREWDISPYRGKRGEVRIVDDSTDNWGHIVVDEIAQYALH
jgi:arabinofuranosyltransferase